MNKYCRHMVTSKRGTFYTYYKTPQGLLHNGAALQKFLKDFCLLQNGTRAITKRGSFFITKRGPWRKTLIQQEKIGAFPVTLVKMLCSEYIWMTFLFYVLSTSNQLLDRIWMIFFYFRSFWLLINSLIVDFVSKFRAVFAKFHDRSEKKQWRSSMTDAI